MGQRLSSLVAPDSFNNALTRLASLENRDKLMSTTGTGALHYITAYKSISEQ
jgi:hypothetical protein